MKFLGGFNFWGGGFNIFWGCLPDPGGLNPTPPPPPPRKIRPCSMSCSDLVAACIKNHQYIFVAISPNNNDIKLVLYADDTNIFITGDSRQNLIEKANNVLQNRTFPASQNFPKKLIRPQIS